jgi:hypothetical protein
MAWFRLTSLAFGYTQAGNDKNRAATVPALATLAESSIDQNPVSSVLRVRKPCILMQLAQRSRVPVSDVRPNSGP